MSKDAVTTVLFSLLCVVLVLSCSSRNSENAVLGPNVIFQQQNSDGGSNVPSTSENFGLSKVSVGGNINNSKSASANFILSGGVNSGL